MKAIGEVRGRADTVIDALMEYFKDGLLLLPTHTWKQMNENYNYFDPKVEASCVGILTNIFRKRPNVVRSLHPTHSIAGYGKNAEEYLMDEENVTTPTPSDGAWGRLRNKDTKILLIGCNFTRNTFIHAVEEKKNVSDRIKEDAILLKIKTKDAVIDNWFHKHETLRDPNYSDNFRKIEDTCINLGILEYHKFGDALTYVVNALKFSEFLENLLDKDKGLFNNNSEVKY
jgi:aminoglycoside 3-N-acetyltransferase